MPLVPLDIVLEPQFRCRYPDGSTIYPSPYRENTWKARWANQTPLRGCDDHTGVERESYFDSPRAAAKALADGGDGPASLTFGHEFPHGTPVWFMRGLTEFQKGNGE